MCAPARKNWVLAHRVTLPWVWGREQCVEVELGALLIMDPLHTLVRLREAQTQFAADTSLCQVCKCEIKLFYPPLIHSLRK